MSKFRPFDKVETNWTLDFVERTKFHEKRVFDIVVQNGNIVAKNGNSVEATFDFVERTIF